MLALIAAFGWVLSSLSRRTPQLKDLMAPLSGKQWKLEQVAGLLGPILSTCPAVALFLCSLSQVLAVSGCDTFLSAGKWLTTCECKIF